MCAWFPPDTPRIAPEQLVKSSSSLIRFTLSAGLCVLVAPAVLRAQDSAAVLGKSGKWSAAMSTLNGLRGAADLRVEPQGGKDSRARLSIRNAPINRQLAWDIVAGSCGDEGRPVAAGAAFRQILTRNDGTGDATARIPKLEPGKRYYVRLFEPSQVPGDRTGVGCANLSEEP
jgi:hypothetical protein